MALLQLQLVTPGGTGLQLEAKSISIMTAEGHITILPGHTPLVAVLHPGEMVIKTDKGTQEIHVAGGFVHVEPGSKVTVLADEAEHSHKLDETHAHAAKKRAEELLTQSNLSDEEYAKAAATLEISLSKLRTIRRRTHHSRKPITSEGVLHE